MKSCKYLCIHHTLHQVLYSKVLINKCNIVFFLIDNKWKLHNKNILNFEILIKRLSHINWGNMQVLKSLRLFLPSIKKCVISCKKIGPASPSTFWQCSMTKRIIKRFKHDKRLKSMIKVLQNVMESKKLMLFNSL